jgi:hypothetical protein
VYKHTLKFNNNCINLLYYKYSKIICIISILSILLYYKMFNKLEARVLSEYKRSRAAPSTFCTLIKHYFSFIKHYIIYVYCVYIYTIYTIYTIYSLTFTQTLTIYTLYTFDYILIIYVYCVYIYTIYTQYTLYTL